MMKSSLLALVAIGFACSISADPAQAQRVFVAATGADSNPCTFAAPCRSFQHAHDVTGTGGEIDVLDPAGYGSLTITKAISIQGHGFSGVTVTSGANGITVNAGPSDAITLNGLIIDGGGAGANGIVFNSGGKLTIADCLVQNSAFDGSHITTGNGILIQPTSGTVLFTITNTIVAGNGYDGIQYSPPSGSPNFNGTIDNVTATSSGFSGIGITPIHASGGATVISISNSTVSRNVEGIVGENLGVTLSIDSVTVSDNGQFGIFTTGGAKVLLGRSVITGNSTGIQNTTANTFFTYEDNRINKNITADICSSAGCSPVQTLGVQ